jgi:hypothetical protein
MIKHIRLIPLIIGIIVGIIGIYFVKPEQSIIYKYPTPENAGKLIYKDKNGLCYKYTSKEVNCDANESRLKDYPITS